MTSLLLVHSVTPMDGAELSDRTDRRTYRSGSVNRSETDNPGRDWFIRLMDGLSIDHVPDQKSSQVPKGGVRLDKGGVAVFSVLSESREGKAAWKVGFVSSELLHCSKALRGFGAWICTQSIHQRERLYMKRRTIHRHSRQNEVPQRTYWPCQIKWGGMSLNEPITLIRLQIRPWLFSGSSNKKW